MTSNIQLLKIMILKINKALFRYLKYNLFIASKNLQVD